MAGAQLEPGRTVEDQVIGILRRLVARSEAWKLAHERRQGDLALESSQRSTKAVVDSHAEPAVPAQPAADVEDVGVPELVGIPVRGAEDEHDLASPGNTPAGEHLVSVRPPGDHLDR